MRTLWLAFPLALTACGGEPQGETAAPEPASAATPAAAPIGSAAQPTSGAIIPVRFHGVWDDENASCDQDTDLRLDIEADGIGFYESHGTPTRVTEGPDNSAMLDLAMAGEGDTWAMSMTLSLTGQSAGADKRLIVQHKGEPRQPAPEPLRLKPCPA
ncbi:MAG: hypothetical protein KAF27_08790 [Porphyrobacter sp.]|nr:hypothetical protein [Porphyrobacter sp.]